MRGRKPRPRALKLLDGNPGKRPLNKHEPQPAPGVPPCPEFLSTAAKREWRRVAPELLALGLLTHLDRAALAAYCESWATYTEAVEWMEQNGRVMTVRDDKGAVKWTAPVPQYGISIKALNQVRAFCSEFGLSPASRARLQVPAAPERRPKDGVLNGQFTPTNDFVRTPAAPLEPDKGPGKVN